MPSRARQSALEGSCCGQRGVDDLSGTRGLHHAQLVSVEDSAREGRADMELCGRPCLWPSRSDERQGLAAPPRAKDRDGVAKGLGQRGDGDDLEMAEIVLRHTKPSS